MCPGETIKRYCKRIGITLRVGGAITQAVEPPSSSHSYLDASPSHTCPLIVLVACFAFPCSAKYASMRGRLSSSPGPSHPPSEHGADLHLHCALALNPQKGAAGCRLRNVCPLRLKDKCDTPHGLPFTSWTKLIKIGAIGPQLSICDLCAADPVTKSTVDISKWYVPPCRASSREASHYRDR